jgi:hypothetical protein
MKLHFVERKENPKNDIAICGKVQELSPTTDILSEFIEMLNSSNTCTVCSNRVSLNRAIANFKLSSQ